jgi:hypothetical protein
MTSEKNGNWEIKINICFAIDMHTRYKCKVWSGFNNLPYPVTLSFFVQSQGSALLEGPSMPFVYSATDGNL